MKQHIQNIIRDFDTLAGPRWRDIVGFAVSVVLLTLALYGAGLLITSATANAEPAPCEVRDTIAAEKRAVRTVCELTAALTGDTQYTPEQIRVRDANVRLAERQGAFEYYLMGCTDAETAQLTGTECWTVREWRRANDLFPRVSMHSAAYLQNKIAVRNADLTDGQPQEAGNNPGILPLLLTAPV